ncbi:MAG: flagellar hook-length control protein FliK [Acidobacteriota bacterium]
MTINPTNIPPAALPPSVKGGGNAPSRRPASGDPFASVIAQISGADEAGVVGNTSRRTVSLASRKRGTEALEDAGGSSVPSTRDAGDPTIINVAVPAWLWTVQDQPRSLGLGPAAQSQTAGGSGAAADTLESTGSSDAPRMGPVADLFPGMAAVPLAGAASQDGAAAVQTDHADQLSASTIAAPVGGQSTPALPAGVPPGLGAGAAPPTDSSLAPTDRFAGPAVQTDTTDPQNVSSASTDQPGSTQSRIAPRRVGRVPAAYADAALAPGLRPAGQSANGVAATTTFSSNSQAGSSRITDNLRASTDRAAGSPTVLADGQSGLAAALLAGRAQTGTAQNPADQDSAHSSPNSRGRAEDIQALVAQALDAPVAPAFDAAVVGAVVQTDHAFLQTGQAAEHVSSLDRTSAASAATLLSGIADRSAAIDEVSLHRQMVQAIQLQSRNGVGDARITLQPEYLGEVTIALRVEDGGVTAHVSAASAEVRAWLGANESLLRHGLSEQGLTLDRLIVSDEPAEPSRDSKGGNARQQQSQQDQEPRPRPRRDTSTFEITL